jgi:putative DNA primase/helicase
LQWQEIGLAPSAAVRKATAAYLEAEDLLGAWLEECCDLDPTAWELSGRLFDSYRAHAERSGEKAGSSKQLGQMLERRGFQRKRIPSARGFEGLRLRVLPGDGPNDA